MPELLKPVPTLERATNTLYSFQVLRSSISVVTTAAAQEEEEEEGMQGVSSCEECCMCTACVGLVSRGIVCLILPLSLYPAVCCAAPSASCPQRPRQHIPHEPAGRGGRGARPSSSLDDSSDSEQGPP